jgi:RNA polymerase sigma-70 factor, ECF subfamily
MNFHTLSLAPGGGLQVSNLITVNAAERFAGTASVDEFGPLAPLSPFGGVFHKPGVPPLVPGGWVWTTVEVVDNSFTFPRKALSSERTEERLLARAISGAKQGDDSALHFLYVRYADDIFGYVRSIVRDYHEAEDVTQNVFVKLPKAIQKYEQREVPFAAWILRVARNASLDYVRARRMVPCEELRTRDESYDMIGFDRWHCLKEALDCLPDDQREVLILRHIAGLSPGEIALLVGKTEGSIHGLHHRGRSALQATLTDLEVAPATATA